MSKANLLLSICRAPLTLTPLRTLGGPGQDHRVREQARHLRSRAVGHACSACRGARGIGRGIHSAAGARPVDTYTSKDG